MTGDNLELKSANLHENHSLLEIISAISSGGSQKLSQLLDRFATLNRAENVIAFAHLTPRSPITYRLIDQIC
jgi:hypothetical protein